MTAGELLRRFSDAIDGRDWDALADLLHPDFVGRFVHTGETFDRDFFVRLNRDYPGEWRFVWEDVVDAGERAVGRAKVSNDSATYYVATFITARDRMIAQLVEVWTDEVGEGPTDAPRPSDQR